MTYFVNNHANKRNVSQLASKCVTIVTKLCTRAVEGDRGVFHAANGPFTDWATDLPVIEAKAAINIHGVDD